MRSGFATVSSLKWSLGLSLLIHAAVCGGMMCYGLLHKSTARIEVEDNVTLELIAAPASVDEPVVAATAPQPVVPPPVPVAEPPPPVVPPEPPPPEPTPPETTVPKTMVAPQTPLPLAPVAPVEVAKVAVAVPQPPQSQPSTKRGDGSSVTPGRDATTAEGKPAAKAHPNYLKNPEPLYPAAARRRHQEGQVLLTVRVEASGRPASVTVKQTSGVPSLDAAALNAVREWQFEPARVRSIAVESEIEVPILFRMKE